MSHFQPRQDRRRSKVVVEDVAQSRRTTPEAEDERRETVYGMVLETEPIVIWVAIYEGNGHFNRYTVCNPSETSRVLIDDFDIQRGIGQQSIQAYWKRPTVRHTECRLVTGSSIRNTTHYRPIDIDSLA